MATYIPVTNLPMQFFDADGAPAVASTLKFYLGGTSTPTDLFSDNAGTSIGTEIDLNSLGLPESGGNVIHLFRDQSKAIKIEYLDDVGATIYTTGTIPAVASFDSTASTKLGYITVASAVDLNAMVTATAAKLPLAGGTLTGNLTLGAGVFMYDSVTAGITASVTQTQTNGPLISAFNEVSVCANALDTVTLPATVTGKPCVVTNNGAETLQIFPPVDSYIDALAVDTATTLAPGHTAIFKAYSSTKWERVNTGPVILTAAMDNVTDTAACSVSNYFTTLTTTGAAVPTLADGVEKQLKMIQMIVDVGDAVLTPANLTGGTTITFADVGDRAELMFTGGSWQVIALYNIVDGATAPVLA